MSEALENSRIFREKLKNAKILLTSFDRIIFSSERVHQHIELNKSLGFLIRGISLVFFELDFS